MKNRKWFRGTAAALVVTLVITTAVPGLATEFTDGQPEEEAQILSGAETGTEDGFETVPEEEVEPDVGTAAGPEAEFELYAGIEAEPETQTEQEPTAQEEAGIDSEPVSDAEEAASVPQLLAADPDSDSDEEPYTDPGPVVESVAVSVSPSTLNVVGQTAQLTATISPAEAEYESVTWSSSNTSAATVDQNGTVTAGSSSDTVTITATVTYTDGTDTGTVTGTCAVEVSLYNGLYQDPDGSSWYYYTNGKVNTGKTAVVSGKVNGTTGYWNVVNGQLLREATVAKYNGDWWYFNSAGMLDKSYTGFATNANGSWYMEKGKLERDENGVIKDTNGALGSTSDWYYVLNSKVQTGFTGLANYSNASGWWYITKGKVDRTYNGLAKNENGWYYLTNGKVDRSYTGFATNANGSWYVTNGKLTRSDNTVIKDTKGVLGAKSEWYYVTGSKVQYGFTGLANYSNSSGWWYITNGKVDRTYNGLAKNKNGWYYLTNGKVNRSYTGFASNSNGDWYVQSGKVTKTAKSVYKDTTGALGSKSDWYYVSGSKVQYGFTGIASNSNGSWYINNGKLDRSYNGSYTYNGTTYTVTNGKAVVSYSAVGMSQSMYNKAQSQSSSTKWLIMVDVDNCKLGIFQGSYGNWTPYKCWDCTTGAPGSPTCRGSYTIYGKGYAFGDDDHTCYYYSQFNGNYLIHSILYYPGTFNVKDGRLGMHLSNGCVRLSLDHAKWVYNNVPYNTRVVTY